MIHVIIGLDKRDSKKSTSFPEREENQRFLNSVAQAKVKTIQV